MIILPNHYNCGVLIFLILNNLFKNKRKILITQLKLKKISVLEKICHSSC